MVCFNSSLVDQLRSVAGQYSRLAVDAAVRHVPALQTYYRAWRDALADTSGRNDGSPIGFSTNSERAWLEYPRANSKVLGIAGPGAVGKDAFEQRLKASEPAMAKVVSSTTRPPRVGETDGVEYHFLSEEAFASRAADDDFLLVQHREGRGSYGVLKATLNDTLRDTRRAFIQESPRNLVAIRNAVGARPDVSFAFAYLVPPAPVFSHLTLRYFTRSLVGGATCDDDAVVANMHGTLGLRQVDEFRSAVAMWEGGEPVRFLINDVLDAPVAVAIRDFYCDRTSGKQDA